MIKILKPQISVLDVITAWVINQQKKSENSKPEATTNITLRHQLIKVHKLGFEVDFSQFHNIQSISYCRDLHESDIAFLCESSISFTVNQVNLNNDKCECQLKMCNVCNAQENLDLIFEHLDIMKIDSVVHMFNMLIKFHPNQERLKEYLLTKDRQIREWLADKIVISDFDHLLKYHCKRNIDISNLGLRDITRLGLERKFDIHKSDKDKMILFLDNSQVADKISEIYNQ
jgi:hypothetical protein